MYSDFKSETLIGSLDFNGAFVLHTFIASCILIVVDLFDLLDFWPLCEILHGIELWFSWKHLVCTFCSSFLSR